jgi:hypothetical protein
MYVRARVYQATKHGIETSLLDALLDGGREFFHQLPQMKQEFSHQIGGSQDQAIDWSERVRLAIEPEDERDMSRWPDYQHYFR